MSEGGNGAYAEGGLGCRFVYSRRRVVIVSINGVVTFTIEGSERELDGVQGLRSMSVGPPQFRPREVNLSQMHDGNRSCNCDVVYRSIGQNK